MTLGPLRLSLYVAVTYGDSGKPQRSYWQTVHQSSLVIAVLSAAPPASETASMTEPFVIIQLTAAAEAAERPLKFDLNGQWNWPARSLKFDVNAGTKTDLHGHWNLTCTDTEMDPYGFWNTVTDIDPYGLWNLPRTDTEIDPHGHWNWPEINLDGRWNGSARES